MTKSSISIVKPPTPAEGGKSFLYNVGDSNFLNFDNLIQFSNLSSSTDQNEIGNFLPLNKPKESCYTCYKLLISENAIKVSNKFFCSGACKEIFASDCLVN